MGSLPGGDPNQPRLGAAEDIRGRSGGSTLRLLLFVPSYNDAASAHALAMRFLGEGGVVRAMIVDDSDEPASAAYAEAMREPGVEVVRRRRAGKWSAWRLALEASEGFDGLVEVDSDVVVRSPGLVPDALVGWDVVTAHQDVVVPDGAGALSRRLGEVYRDAHMRLRAAGKFNMGGRLIALSSRAVDALLGMGFFLEPVPGDDHVICLAAAALGLRHRSIDCGMEIRAPARLNEWIRYRSRHRGVIGWSEEYMASKTGLREETLRASRRDYRETVAAFLSSLLNPPRPDSLLLLALLGLCSLLPLEDRATWSMLETTKEAAARARRPTAEPHNSYGLSAEILTDPS